MTVTPDIFINAIRRGETADFLAGAPPYFIEAKDDNEEPQNFRAAFDLAILTTWNQLKDPLIPSSFEAGLLCLLEYFPDSNRAIYAASSWLWLYRYRLKESRSNTEGICKSIFEVNMKMVALTLRSSIETNEAALKNDQRWAGASWNSPDGLWTPLIRQAISVRDKLGGPDFVPRTIGVTSF